MARYVVYNAHSWGSDDKCEVPDMDDFKSLSEKINSVKKLCLTAVTQKVFETRVAAVERSVGDAKQQMEDAVKAIFAAITNGEWRNGFERDVAQALEQLEMRYAAINEELNKKIEELANVSMMEAALSQKIVDFQENIRSMLVDTTINREQFKKSETSIAKRVDNIRQLLVKRMRGTLGLTCVLVVGVLIAIVSLLLTGVLQ